MNFVFLIIGVVLMATEVMSGDFTLLLFGAGFVLAALAGWIAPMGWAAQTMLAFVLALILLFTLKKPLKRRFGAKGMKDNFLDESGVGEVREGMVFYKGTFWKSDEIVGLKEGDKVEVAGVRDGKIELKNHK